MGALYSTDADDLLDAMKWLQLGAGIASDVWAENWNDDYERTFPEVKAAFLKAIELAKAAEGGTR
jgi:hypothetical protein